MSEASVTAFLADRRIAGGDRATVTRLIEDRYPGDHGDVRVFDDETGRVVDLDYWDAGEAAPQRRRGRPRLGVTAREVTLLPRHWEWLARQPGGASAALRRLVEAARHGEPGPRARCDAAYHFMQATCGDRPHYEEALRALYRGDEERFAMLVSDWPEDIRAYLERLLGAPAARLAARAD